MSQINEDSANIPNTEIIPNMSQINEDSANIPNTEIIPNMDERIAKLESALQAQQTFCGQIAKLVDVLCQRCNVSIEAVLSTGE